MWISRWILDRWAGSTALRSTTFTATYNKPGVQARDIGERESGAPSAWQAGGRQV